MKTRAEAEPRVRSFEPKPWFDRMTRIANAFVGPLLRSSAGKRMHDLALLSFVGRRSGKRYEVPVAFHELDGEPVILTARRSTSRSAGSAPSQSSHVDHLVS
jgi:hypothetical protein